VVNNLVNLVNIVCKCHTKKSSLYFAYLRHATKTAEQSPRKSSPAVAKISVIQGWSAKPDEDVDLIEGCNRKITE
jgi:hypothetical protein